MKMTQRTTIITGGTGGIGAETALRLLCASPERHVALVDLHAETVPDLLSEHKDRIGLYSCDVTKPEVVKRAAHQIAAELPPSDSLVNGAGIVHNAASIDIDIRAFRNMQAVHVDGALLWSQALARSLDGAPGSIVSIGSIAGQFGHPRRVAYAVAKAAIHSMTKTLAVEWAPLHIRVNAVAPGYIETPMLKEVAKIGLVDSEKSASWAAMKRLGDPAEVANAIYFLLSDEASFITGHVLNVDGGFAVLKAE